MNQFNVFLPISKALAVGTESSTRMTDVNDKGQQRTRYKLVGVASTTSIDRDTETVSKECLKHMAASIKTKRLPIFSNHKHEWEEMLGYADEADVMNDEMRIGITTDFEDTNPRVKQLIGKLEAGLPIGLSIGGKVKSSKPYYDNRLGKDVNVIQEVELLETSVVGIGANPDAFLSLPDQIAKSFKGDGMELEKDGSSSQGAKAGEVTPQTRCPLCGKAGELREVVGKIAHYLCPTCGAAFTVVAEGAKVVAKPISQPAKVGSVPIDQQVQEPLGKKSLKTEGEVMTKAEIKKEAAVEEPKEEEAKPAAESEEVDEEAYKSFVKCMNKYLKEVKSGTQKAEGMSVPPGAENAKPAGSIEGKSVKDFNAMKKAIKENTDVVEMKKDAEEADLTFGKMYRSIRGKRM